MCVCECVCLLVCLCACVLFEELVGYQGLGASHEERQGFGGPN